MVVTGVLLSHDLYFLFERRSGPLLECVGQSVRPRHSGDAGVQKYNRFSYRGAVSYDLDNSLTSLVVLLFVDTLRFST